MGAARALCSDLTDRVGLLRSVEADELRERKVNADTLAAEGRRRREVRKTAPLPETCSHPLAPPPLRFVPQHFFFLNG